MDGLRGTGVLGAHGFGHLERREGVKLHGALVSLLGPELREA